jgi:hypothetical protein
MRAEKPVAEKRTRNIRRRKKRVMDAKFWPSAS